MSTLSQPDADQKAQTDVNTNGPAYANANGTCITPPLTGVNNSNSSSTAVNVQFYNTCTVVTYNFTSNTGTTALGQVPVGTYNIYMSPNYSGTYTYRVNGYTQRTSTGANFYSIPVTGTLQVNITN